MRSDNRQSSVRSRVLLIFLAAATFLLFWLIGSHVRRGTEMSAADLPQTYDASNELRAVWVPSVANITFPSRQGLSEEQLKAELDGIVEKSADAGMNAVFFQVRPSCDALYASQLFPASRFVSGTEGEMPGHGFDCLAYLLEAAQKRGIAVHAWVNPFRVTTTAEEAESLAGDSFAVLHPEYAVKYADNKIYLDPGIPEVRDYVVSGVEELVTRYPSLSGVVFDDYFYPYPSNNAPFDDADTYETYGGGLSLADFRRESVNELVKRCHDAVKAADPDKTFGISPFGIYANKGTGAPVVGSDTKGLEAYHVLYCDALAWAKGGYVDFLAPQIYWSFDTAVAPFDTLADWWDKNLEGTGVKLIIGHAVYQAPYFPENEIALQIEYARTKPTYGGSAFYAYNDLIGNTDGVLDGIRRVYAGGSASQPVSDFSELTVGELNKDYAHLKVSPSSSFYDDYTPGSKGMRDYIVSEKDGYYRFKFGAYAAKENVDIIRGEPVDYNLILSVKGFVNGTDTSNHDHNFTDIVFKGTENCPVNAVASAGKITVTFYNTLSAVLPKPTLERNPVVASIDGKTVDETTVMYTVNLKDEFCNFGYNVVYENGNVILRLNNPQTLADSDKPLSGKRIVIDAGHGGTDIGAPGHGNIHESGINLSIALELQKDLEALGATVIMTRTADTYIDLYERMDFFNEVYPDFLISVHQNSLTDTSVHGYLSLFCAESGRLAAKTISPIVVKALDNRYEFPYRYQALAVARNHRFPSTLSEMCFVSNPAEYQWCMDKNNLKRSADALRDGILAYYKAQEKYLEY